MPILKHLHEVKKYRRGYTSIISLNSTELRCKQQFLRQSHHHVTLMMKIAAIQLIPILTVLLHGNMLTLALALQIQVIRIMTPLKMKVAPHANATM